MTDNSKNEKSVDLAGEHASFTEAEYGRLLDLAAAKYRFCDYVRQSDQPFVLWRHDVDYSPHRALALARLEAARGLRCIYHVLPGSRYYNPFEIEVVAVFRAIAALGHELGLHFDMDAFGEDGVVTEPDFDKRVSLERDVLEAVIGIELKSMSFHNFHINRERLVQRDTICNLVNASSVRFMQGFKYVSDSNGIWRYDRLRDVLEQPSFARLHVLTHPEWWTEQPMPPVERLNRVIKGRADASFDIYAHQLRRDGRLRAIGERIGFSADYIAAALAKDKES
ncbi:MAG: hypothetical protein ACK4UO_06920 [Pseudolabrys sp.]